MSIQPYYPKEEGQIINHASCCILKFNKTYWLCWNGEDVIFHKCYKKQFNSGSRLKEIEGEFLCSKCFEELPEHWYNQMLLRKLE